ncbi:MAG: restriction endonuclease subunit S, partial [bacterium]|nr:restriction endonuclease subunit S [bacterium]
MEEFDENEFVVFRGADRLAYETRNGETVCIEDELPFKIPETWAWVRLGEISNYGQCVGTDNVPKGAWMLDLEDIEKGGRLLIKNRTRES